MNIERLKALANLLATIPPEKFDLDSWRIDEHGAEFEPEDVSDEKLRDPACGTCGCAVGWACAMPDFQEQGLCWSGAYPTFGPHRSWIAVNSFFEISHDQALEFFSIDFYDQERPTAMDVAERIMSAVDEYEAGSRLSVTDDAAAVTPLSQ